MPDDVNPQEPGKPTPPAGNGDRTFTQQEVDAIVGERAKRASEAAVTKLLEKFGLPSVEALETTMTKAKDLEQANLSETEKLKQEAEKYRTKLTETESVTAAKLAQANERLLKAAVMAEAAKAEHKITPEALPDVWLFVDRAKLEMDDDGNVKGLEDAVKSVLKARPYLTVASKAPAPPKRENGRQPAPPKPDENRPRLKL